MFDKGLPTLNQLTYLILQFVKFWERAPMNSCVGALTLFCKENTLMVEKPLRAVRNCWFYQPEIDLF
jgi:hypothetical protein